MRNLLVVIALASLAPSSAAGRDLGRFQARFEAGGSVAGGDEPTVLGVALRSAASWRPLVLEASFDGGWAPDGGPRSYDLVFLGGAGGRLALRGRWYASFLAVGGVHAVQTTEPGGIGYQDHALPLAGARIGLTRGPTSRRLFQSTTLAVTFVSDLRREPDFFLGRDIGGSKVILSATLGVGIAR